MIVGPKFTFSLFVLLLVSVSAVSAADAFTIRSRSGQFYIRGVAAPRVSAGALDSVGARVRLDPSILSVTCERVKRTLFEMLSLGDTWKGRIYVSLHSAKDDDGIRMISLSYTDGWSYRLELPDEIEPDRLTRALVEVLLREVSNRRAGTRQAELPAWLREGLVAHIQAIAGNDFVLAPQTRTISRKRLVDAVSGIRRRLGNELPMTVDRLSWPTSEDWVDGGIIYKASAQLLVTELLRLDGEKKAMANLILLLPSYLNWQLAFAHAYGEHFPALIHFHKWWSVTTVTFGDHGKMFRWDGRATVKRLEEIVTIPVEVRLSSSELPMRGSAKLQQVIREWDYAQQVQLLNLRLNHLQVLALRSPADTVGMVNEYMVVIANYLKRRASVRRVPQRQRANEQRKAVVNAIAALDDLDVRRGRLKRALQPAQRAANEEGARGLQE